MHPQSGLQVPQSHRIVTLKYFTAEIFCCRRPEVYRDRTVLLLGAFYSGLDISVDLAPFAKKVLNVPLKSFRIYFDAIC